MRLGDSLLCNEHLAAELGAEIGDEADVLGSGLERSPAGEKVAVSEQQRVGKGYIYCDSGKEPPGVGTRKRKGGRSEGLGREGFGGGERSSKGMGERGVGRLCSERKGSGIGRLCSG
jgi:hypothetical protein